MFNRLKQIVGYMKSVGIPIYLTNVLFKNFLRIDSDCPFNKNYTSRIISGKKIKIENNSLSVLKSFSASNGCYIQAVNGIEIGEGTIFSFNVSIVSLDHDAKDYNNMVVSDPIKVGRNCWLGAGVVILPGIELGDNVIVGANSVVTKSFSNGNVVIAGAPARLIKGN